MAAPSILVAVTEMEIKLSDKITPCWGSIRFKCEFTRRTTPEKIVATFSDGEIVTFMNDANGMYTVRISGREINTFPDLFGWCAEGMVFGQIDIGRKDADEWTIWKNEFPGLEMWP